MKKVICLPLLVIMLSLAGCDTDPVAPTLIAEESTATIDPEILTTIEEMGFSTDDIYASEDAYIVEGDMMISKERLEEMKNEPRTRHNKYRGDHLIDIEAHKSVEISVWNNGNVSQNVALNRYRSVLADAVAVFKDVCPVKLVSSNEDKSSDITIQYDAGITRESMCAAGIPSDGYPGVWILVNADPAVFAGNWNTISITKLKSTLIHAIAHCLGLAHTNLSGMASNVGYPEIETSTESIPGTHSDNASLMTMQEHLYNHSGASTLSAGDKLALSILYQKTTPALNLEIYGPSSGKTDKKLIFTVNDGSSLLSTSKYTIKWTASGGVISGGDTGNELGVAYSSVGNKTISVYAKNKATGQEATKSLSVNIEGVLNPGTISGNQTILSGHIPALLTGTALPTGGSGTYKYQWQQSPDGKSSSWKDIPNAKSKDYQPSALTSTTYYKRDVFSGTQTVSSNVIQVIAFTPVITGNYRIGLNVNTTYSVPASLPTGVTFTGWTLPTGSDYSVTGGTESHSLTIKFSARRMYTLIANFNFPDGTTYSADKTVTAMSVVIRGAYRPESNTYVTYSILNEDISAGASFLKWSVSPYADYTVQNGLDSHTLTIRFTQAQAYNLTAHFRLNNGNNTYSISKTVNLAPPPPPPPGYDLPTPVLMVEKDDPTAPTGWATIRVTIPVPGVEYQWQRRKAGEGVSEFGRGSHLSEIMYRYDDNLPWSMLRCRAILGNKYSDWANAVSTSILL